MSLRKAHVSEGTFSNVAAGTNTRVGTDIPPLSDKN